MALSVVICEDEVDLAPHRGAWEDLARCVVEPNPFYEPWMLLPALRGFGGDADLLFVLVYARGDAADAPAEKLIGFFPLERQRRFRGLPFGAVGFWRYIHCYECTPLVRPGHAESAIDSLLAWLAADRRGSVLLEIPHVAADSHFHQSLVDFLNKRDTPNHSIDHWTRALWRPRADGDAYLAEALNHKRRKEFHRLERRLADQGPLEWVELAEPSAVADWADEFLALEAKGWKGKDGGALALTEANRVFFHEVIGAAFGRGRLLLSALRLNGKALAMKCSFRAVSGSYAFKIAFDEEYARFSPGVLLELENIRRLHRQSELRWMDSCAVPHHSMINRLWLDRRPLHSVLVATGRRGSHLLLALVPLLKWLKSLCRRRRPASSPTAVSGDRDSGATT